MKPKLEMLEDRIQPSGSASMEFVASPPASASVATITSFVFSMLEQRSQLIAAIEQDLSNALNAFGQEIAQEASAVQQQVDHLLGINPAPSTPSPSTAVPQPSDSGSGRGNSSGSGSGKGTMITSQSTPNQALNNSTQQAGSGSGSGSSTTTAHENTAGHGAMKVHPMARSGSGGGAVSPTGNGSGPAIVYGHVWLDNNGDGSWNNKELGYYGATVYLDNPDGTIGDIKTTNIDGYYEFDLQPNPGNQFMVQVVFPSYFEATIPGGDSQIDDGGYSFVFALNPGGMQQIQAGLRSMNVTTTADDVNGPIRNQVTLRDAIQTGNNGPPDSAITFIDPKTGQNLSGTIALQDALDPIETNYNIDGPGASTLTIQGGGAHGVFIIDSGVTSAINNLSIKGGEGKEGGGIDNLGDLTLSYDDIYGNQASVRGGGVHNAIGAKLILNASTVSNNSALSFGGGIANEGALSICCGSQIYSNQANIGGGLSNSLGHKVIISSQSSIYNNQAVVDGGGISNSGTLTMSGSAVQGNTAGNIGGGIFTLGGSLTLTSGVAVSKNTAVRGGGIFIQGGNVKMTGGSISSNKAKAYDAAPGGGGGVYFSSGSLTLTNVRVSSNKVSGGNGAGIFSGGGNAHVIGGTIQFNSGGNGAGIYITKGGTVTESGGTIAFNTADSDCNGGGIYNMAGALTLQGGTYIGPENSAEQGGGMYLAAQSTTTLNAVTISGNVASNGGAGVYQQKNANITSPMKLTDYDDPGGKPFQGP